MLNSPVVVIPIAEEKKTLATTSPTSTADEFMDCEDTTTTGFDATINRLSLSSIGSISNLGSPKTANKKFRAVVLKTIHNAELKIPFPFSTVAELKSQLCSNSVLDSKDLMIIRKGKEMRNEEQISESELQSSKVFVVLRTTASASVPITLKPQGIPGGVTKTLKVPLNMRVFQFKKQLTTSKFTSLKSDNQRIIVGGKVMHNTSMIGDYLLQFILGAKPSSSAKAPSDKPVPVATLYLSRTINVKHEVEVELPLTNGTTIKCPLEISQPISQLTEQLHRRYHFPLPNDSFYYVFSLRVPRSSKLVDAASDSGHASVGPTLHLKKSIMDNSANKHSQWDYVELDQARTLLDYGFTQSTKAISVEVARSHHLRQEDTRPVELSDMLFIYLATQAQRRVERQAQGLPVDDFLPNLPMPLRIPLRPLPSVGSSSGSSGSRSMPTRPSMDQPPSSQDIQSMLRAMGMNQGMIDSLLAEPEAAASSTEPAATQESVRPSSSVTKKRASPDTSSASSSTSPKKTTASAAGAAKGGLFGGLKKGFLSGGSKKEPKS